MLHMSIQVWRNHTGLPRAMALRFIRFRPGDRLSCHHHRHRLSPPPTWRQHRGVGPKRFHRTQVPRSSVATSRPPLPAPRLRRWPTPLGGTGWRES